MSQIHDTNNNDPKDLPRSSNIQFGDFHESPNVQNAPLGANPTAGTPAFNNVSGPGFPGPFGGGSHLPPPPNQNALFGANMNPAAPAFHNTSGPGFPGPSGGGSHMGPFNNATPQFELNFSSPFMGQNSYVSSNTNYPINPFQTQPQPPFQPQMLNPNSAFTNYGYAMTMIPSHNPPAPSSSSTPLRITVGNIITHSDSCPMCMGYATHLITVSKFNEIIVLDQLSGTTNLMDRITALESERDELRAHHASDVAQIDEIVRDCQEAHDRRQYWKDQYYDLRDQGDHQNTQTQPTVSVAKKLDKGKGREMPTIPLRQRIATTETKVAKGSSIPLSQQLSPMEGDWNSHHVPEHDRASRSGQAPAQSEAGTSSSKVSYDDLYAEPTGEVQYSYKAYQLEHYLTDMEDDDCKPDAHPNRLKGKQREMQNKINREGKRRMDTKLAQRAKEEGRSPPPKRSRSSKNKEYNVLRGMVTKLLFQVPSSIEEVEKKTVHGMIAMHKQARHVPRAKCSAVDNAVIDRFTTVPQWYEAEMTQQGHTVPKLFEPKPSQKKARNTATSVSYGEAVTAPTAAEATPSTLYYEAGPSHTATTGETIEWRGRRENDSVNQWAESILSSSVSDRLNGMLVESIQGSPTTNTRSIHGMLAVFRLLPNNAGNGVLTDVDSNLLVHLFLCELALHPNRYDGIFHSMGLVPHRSFRPGPLPDYSRTSPPTVRQIAHELVIRGYTKAHLQDLSLYLLWWLHGVAASMNSHWVVIQQQLVHVVNDVLAHHVFQGVPRTTIEVENYVFTDGSQSSNLDNAGRFADYSVVLTYVRSIAQQLALLGTLVGEQPASSITTDDVHTGINMYTHLRCRIQERIIPHQSLPFLHCHTSPFTLATRTKPSPLVASDAVREVTRLGTRTQITVDFPSYRTVELKLEQRTVTRKSVSSTTASDCATKDAHGTSIYARYAEAPTPAGTITHLAPELANPSIDLHLPAPLPFHDSEGRAGSQTEIFYRITTPYDPAAFAIELAIHNLGDRYPFLIRNLQQGFHLGKMPPIIENIIIPNHLRQTTSRGTL
ncbi:hypothetical protein GGU10DRAFT_375402 [Lentinula aff. detonsa]|uniref:Uncharacterized protein n=1 Tax=Lentinula aff. detonsa TaxID=2804958 RepID=A0AA38L5U0_9AGAR|nr:hypothetical protein GGU10DRAFT_375402 [Lentinula aff. detonsa]